MKKIVVSDLIGTIIPTNYLDANYRYYMKEFDIDRMYFHISNSLIQFLKDDNYLIIVSSPGKHGTIDYTFNTLTEKLYLSLYEYKDKIKFYSCLERDCETGIERLNNVATIENINGMKIAKSKFSDFYSKIIEEKSDVFNFVQNEFDLTNCELYSLGDSSFDFNMLLKCQELGGISCVICDDFFEADNVQIIDKYIRLLAAKKGRLKYFRENNREVSNLNTIKLFSMMDEERNKMYDELKQEKIDSNEIMRQYFLYRFLDSSEVKNDIMRINHCFPVEEILKFKVYPTFDSFKNDYLLSKDKKIYQKIY